MSRDLLLLMRAPLAASAISNLVVGAALVAGAPGAAGARWSPRLALALVLLVPATCALYWAGMILNDWFDRDRDADLYPTRPIPSGRVDAGLAARLGFGLLLGGVGLAAAAGAVAGFPLRGLAAGGLVALCVLAYDGGLKRYRLVGSAAMGSCRLSNALLAPIALGLWWPVADGAVALDALRATPALYAGLLGLYVMFLTWLSTFEEQDASPLALGLGFLGALSAPALLILLCFGQRFGLAGLAGALALFALVLAQLFMAVFEGTQARGQAMTRALLKGIWLFDLGVLLGAAVWLGLPVLAALFLLGSWAAGRLFRPPPAPVTIEEPAGAEERNDPPTD